MIRINKLLCLTVYDNLKLSIIEMLAKEKDLLVKKRLVKNREVPNYIKDRLLKELSISTH